MFPPSDKGVLALNNKMNEVLKCIQILLSI